VHIAILLLVLEQLGKVLLAVNQTKVHLAAAAVVLARLVTLTVLVMVETVSVQIFLVTLYFMVVAVLRSMLQDKETILAHLLVNQA
jgi:hypothetical protein